MKPKSILHSCLALTGSALIAISYTQAATLYWDGTDTTANADGGAGAWNGASLWDTSVAAGTAATWTSGDIAVFGGVSGAVTTGAPITTNGIRFNTTGYSITADSTNTLSFTGTSNIVFNNVAAAAITGTVGGAGNVVLSRTNPYTLGVLTLNGESTSGWTGATTVNNGTTLALAQSNQALLGTSGITLNTGAITLTNTLDAEKTLDRVSDMAGIVVNGGGSATYANTSAGGRQYAETLGAVTVNSGQFALLLTTNQAGGQTLTLGSVGSNVSGSGISRASSASTVHFGSGATLNSTTNRIAVYGSTDTTASEIVGPWATTGNSLVNQSDYAIFSGGYVTAAGASLAVTAEDGWVADTTAYQFNTAQTLTADRTAAALRYTAGNNTLALAGFTLKTNGALNGGNGTLTISGTGTLTATGASGGNLFFSGGGFTVSSDIKNNGGAVGVVKTGSGTLSLNSTGNDFTGGLVVNAGTVSLGANSSFSGGIFLNGGTLSNASANARLGDASNNITVNGNATIGLGNGSYARSIALNNGAMLSFGTENFTFTGDVTGTGGLGTNASFSAGGTFNGTGNTFTGPILIAGTGMGNNNYRFSFASLTDSAAANGSIVFNTNSLNGSTGSVFEYTGATNLTLANRQIEINSTGATPSNSASNSFGGHQIRSNGAGSLSINTDLVVTSPYAQTLVLRGTGAGGGAFAGKISDSPNAVAGTTALGAISGSNYLAGVTSLALGSVEGVVVGASISGTGIAGGTTITAINPTTRIVTLSDATTAVIGFNSIVTVAGVTNPVALSKNDAGTWQISGDNSYTGPTNVFAGKLEVTGAGRLGNGNYAGNISIANTSSGALVFNSTANQTLSGVISGSGAFRKDNIGVVTLTNTNAYTGPTTVLGGVLRVNGSLASGSAVTVTGGTLGGTGLIGDSVTVEAAGSLAPGASAGILSIGGGLDISAPVNGGTGKLNFELGANTAASDQLAVTGILTIGSDALDFSDFTFTNLGWQNGTYVLITSGGISGTLDPDLIDCTGPIGGGTGEIKISGNDIVLEITGLPAGSPYDTWATSEGLTGLPGSSTDPAKDADPDNDGRNNLGEFAFGGDPLSGSDNGKVYMLTEDSDFDGDTTKELILTVAVRTGTPAFAGSPSPSANQVTDAITYTIEGSLDLAGFPTTVNVVPTPVTTGLPPAGAGYEYRSFSLAGSNGLTGKGFLRAKVTSP